MDFVARGKKAGACRNPCIRCILRPRKSLARSRDQFPLVRHLGRQLIHVA